MNVNAICSRKMFRYLPLLMWTLLVAVPGLVSCTDDEEDGVNYSYLEDGVNKLVISSSGVVEETIPLKYVIRAKSAWQVKKESEASWLRILNENSKDVEQLSGQGVDTLRLMVNVNDDVEARSVNLLFTEGDTQFAVLRVTQRGADPILKLAGGKKEYDADPNGGTDQKIAIQTNCELDFEVDYGEDGGDWLTVKSADKEGIYVDLKALDFVGTRGCVLTAFKKGDKAKASLAIPVTQWNARKILDDDFSWLNRYKFEGDAQKESDPENFEYYNYPELGYGAWTDEQKHGHGWSALDEDQCHASAGRGYLKLGYTSLVGMFVSPAFSGLNEGEHDVEVTFKAIGYTSKTNVHDNAIFHVAVANGGTVANDAVELEYNGTGQKYNCAKFELKSYPRAKADHDAGIDWDPWAKPECNYSFTIKGANQYTKIIFIGGPVMSYSVKNVKTRMMVDDVKVWEYR